MHKRTKIRCEDLVQQAINECPNLIIKQHLKELHEKYASMEALGMTVFPLLLQMTSTNALESYHSELKRTSSPQHDLIGIYFFIL